MTNDQWSDIATLIASLWRPFAQCMTPEQATAWRNALDDCPLDRVKAALLRWYQHEEGWPILAKIVQQSRVEQRTVKPAYTGPFLPPEVNKAEARRGLEMLAQRRAQRQEDSQCTKS